MAAEVGNRIVHGSAGTSADTVQLNKTANFVQVTNTHASQTLYVTVRKGTVAASPATVAVANADETFAIPAGATKTVVNSPAKADRFNLSILGSGASTTYTVVGSNAEPVNPTQALAATVTATGVAGPAAADAAVTGNPVQIAGRGSDAQPTAMSTDSDVTLPWLSLNGAVNVIHREKVVTVTATPTITAGAYDALDAVGGVMTFAVALASGRAFEIVGARIFDKAVQSVLLQLDLWKASPASPAADNAAYTFTDANALAALPIATIDFLAANYRVNAANGVGMGTVFGVQPRIKSVTSGSANIFGTLKTGTGATPTYGSTSDLVVYLDVVQL